MRHALLLSLALTGCTLTPLSASQFADPVFGTGDAAELELAERLAYEHLYSNQDRYLAGVAGMRTRRVVVDDLANAHVRVQQEVDGIEVFGGQTIVHLRQDGSVRGMTEHWKRDIDVDLTPSYQDGEAIDQAVDAAGGWFAVTNQPTSKLVILRHANTDHLTYQVDIDKLDGTVDSAKPRVFVDAHSGEVVWQYDNLQTLDGHATTAYNGDITFPVTDVGGGFTLQGTGVGTYTLGNGTDYNENSLSALTSADTNFDWDATAADAYWGAIATRDYFSEAHGRDGIDGNGGPNYKDGNITVGVHYGNGVANAFWTGNAMIYGDGDGSQAGPMAALDIAAHEMTHGVTENSAGLIYSGESGALNESMSDVFGAILDQRMRGDGPHVWTIGEQAWTPNIEGDALRYMSNPTADGSSREHYSTRYTGWSDNGGVHWNSGIGNLAFYLVVEGGSHPNPEHAQSFVNGIGMERGASIWYRALTEYMTPDTTFAEARGAFIASAEDLFGAGSPELEAVTLAWTEVGVGVSIDNPEEPEEPEDSGDLEDTGPVDTGIEQEEDPGPIQIGRNVQIDDLSGNQFSTATYLVEIPADAEYFRVALTGGTGDADLRIWQGLESEDVLCIAINTGNEEECVITDPTAGVYRIEIDGFEAYTDVQLSTETQMAASSEDALALRAANELDHATLLETIEWRAADNIVSYRPYTSLQEVDAVPYVGPTALGQLAILGHHHWGGDFVHDIREGSAEALSILNVVNAGDYQTLDIDVGLDQRAVNAILDAITIEEIPTLDALDAVPFMGEIAFDRLLLYVTDFTAPTSECSADDGDLGSGIGQGVVMGNTCGAGDDQATSCGGSGEDLTYKWTAPYSGTFVFDTTGSAIDTLLTARSCAGDELACDDDGAEGMLSRLEMYLAIDQSILLDVDTFDSICGEVWVNISTN